MYSRRKDSSCKFCCSEWAGRRKSECSVRLKVDDDSAAVMPNRLGDSFVANVCFAWHAAESASKR
eukprot:920988-Pleurochrysis_carterae.AAC.1